MSCSSVEIGGVAGSLPGLLHEECRVYGSVQLYRVEGNWVNCVCVCIDFTTMKYIPHSFYQIDPTFRRIHSNISGSVDIGMGHRSPFRILSLF